VTQSTIRPSYSASASAFERCAPVETLYLGGPADSQRLRPRSRLVSTTKTFKHSLATVSQ
jgi:hypothetical protein